MAVLVRYDHETRKDLHAHTSDPSATKHLVLSPALYSGSSTTAMVPMQLSRRDERWVVEFNSKLYAHCVSLACTGWSRKDYTQASDAEGLVKCSSSLANRALAILPFRSYIGCITLEEL